MIIYVPIIRRITDINKDLDEQQKRDFKVTLENDQKRYIEYLTDCEGWKFVRFEKLEDTEFIVLAGLPEKFVDSNYFIK